MKIIHIINRIEGNYISSDLVYPDLISDNRLLRKIVIIDPKYVAQILKMVHGVDYISNKYVIEMEYNNDIMYWYQHDHSTWLLQLV